MKIIWSPLAAERLENIFENIVKDNESATYELIQKIINRVETLIKYPNRGRQVPEANDERIHEVFEGEYRIIYRVSNQNIFVLSIRNFKQLIPPEDLK